MNEYSGLVNVDPALIDMGNSVIVGKCVISRSDLYAPRILSPEPSFAIDIWDVRGPDFGPSFTLIIPISGELGMLMSTGKIAEVWSALCNATDKQ